MNPCGLSFEEEQVFGSESGARTDGGITVTELTGGNRAVRGNNLGIQSDVVTLGKTFAVAFAVGLDVLAISVGVGVARLSFDASLRLVAFNS